MSEALTPVPVPHLLRDGTGFRLENSEEATGFSPWRLTALKSEPIILLPDNLLSRDLESESRLPPFLRGKTPVYTFESILALSQSSSLKPLKAGFEGFVTRMAIGDRDVALKIMFGAQLPESDVSNFLSLLNISDSDRSSLIRRLCIEPPFESVDKTVLTQMGGFILGHELHPDYFPEPMGIISFRGKPVGVCMSFIEGETIQIEDVLALGIVDDPEIEKKLDVLNHAGVCLDYIGGAANAIVRKIGGDRKTTFIDVHLADKRTLQRSNFRDLIEGEYYLGRIEESSGPFDRVSVDVIPRSLTNHQKRIVKYREAQKGASKAQFTFQDVLEGRAVISSPEAKAYFEDSVSRFEKWVAYLQSVGFPVERQNVTLALTQDCREVNYDISPSWKEARKRHKQQRKPVISLRLSQPENTNALSEAEFTFELEWNTDEKYLSLENNKDLIRYHISQRSILSDRSHDILEFDKHINQFSYRRGIGKGRIVKADSLRHMLIFRKFRTEFGIDNLTSLEEIVKSVLHFIQEDNE